MQQPDQHDHDAPHRTPPFSEDAEQAVLSAMLIDGAAVAEARAIVRAESFYSDRNRRIFRAMATLHDAQTVVDPLTLSEHLLAVGELDAAGGKDYIGFLVDAVPTATNIAHHAAIVRERKSQRDLIGKLQQAAELAWSLDADPADLAQKLVAEFLPLAVPSGGEGYVAAKDVIYQLFEEIENRAKSPGLIGVPTGYSEIDDVTGGWREGELAAVCGVPKAGKSVMLTNFLLNNVVSGLDVALLTAEMTRKAVLERMLANIARVTTTQIRDGRMDEREWKALIHAGQRLNGNRGGQLYIDETPGPRYNEVVARARALKIRFPSIRILYVDYLQLIHADDETRAEELRQVSNGLAGLAKELKIPIVVAAQLNDKAIESRADKRPTPADVQGSSGLRQAVSYLGLLYRPSMYEARTVDTLELEFAATRSVGVFTARLEADMPRMRVISPRNPDPVFRQEEFPANG